MNQNQPCGKQMCCVIGASQPGISGDAVFRKCDQYAFVLMCFCLRCVPSERASTEAGPLASQTSRQRTGSAAPDEPRITSIGSGPSSRDLPVETPVPDRTSTPHDWAKTVSAISIGRRSTWNVSSVLQTSTGDTSSSVAESVYQNPRPDLIVNSRRNCGMVKPSSSRCSTVTESVLSPILKRGSFAFSRTRTRSSGWSRLTRIA
jgi:hypothetical protein